jgi:hypothetical protein
MLQLVYDTNLDYETTRESVRLSKKIEKPVDGFKGNLGFRLKGDRNIRLIMITLSGKVMVYCRDQTAVEGSLPLIRSLTLTADGREALWGSYKLVDSPLLRKDAKVHLRNTKTRWSITGYNVVVLKDGTSAEEEVPELYEPSRLSADAPKMLQIRANMLLAQKLLRAKGL